MPINISLEYDAPDVVRIEAFRLPIAPEELRQRLDSLGFTPQVMDEIKIEVSLTDGPFSGPVTPLDSPETITQMDELNYLAAKYDELDTAGKDKFKAVMEYIGHGYSRYPHELGNIGDTIDIVLNLDKFVFYPDVSSLDQLSHRVIENNNQDETEIDLTDIPPEPDYREIGEDILSYDAGCFTNHGYISGGGKGFEPVFLTEGVPEEYRVWEKAFADLPPFENPIHIPYEDLSEGHVDEWQLNTAHEVFELLASANHPIISDGDHKYRGTKIIEIADAICSQDDAVGDMLMDIVLNGGMYGGEAADLIERVSDVEYGLDVQMHLERSYGVDNDFEENYREDLMKLPPDLQFDEYIKVMMENRSRHQQTVTELTDLELPLTTTPSEQLTRFHMLPADKQAAIQIEQDTYTTYCGVKMENAIAMINLYSAKIMEYQEEHMRRGPYDPEKIARATEIKEGIMAAVKKDYECDPNRQPVVNIDSYGCELFPVGKQFPFPVFNELFTQAVEYYGLLHGAGVPLSQNLVYLNMDFVLEGQPEQIKFHTDKAVLLFVDQGKSFMEQIAASNLEPVFREKLTAYLSMHLGVHDQYKTDLEALPDAIKRAFPHGLPEEIFELAPDGNSFLRHRLPDYARQLYDFATEAHENVNQRTDYSAMMFSEPLPAGDIPAIAERFEALIETIDPIGHGRHGFCAADAVAAALKDGNKAKIEDYLGVLDNVDGAYRGVAQKLAAAIEGLPARDVPEVKPSLKQRLAQAKQDAQEQSPKPKDPNKSGPEL